MDGCIVAIVVFGSLIALGIVQIREIIQSDNKEKERRRRNSERIIQVLDRNKKIVGEIRQYSKLAGRGKIYSNQGNLIGSFSSKKLDIKSRLFPEIWGRFWVMSDLGKWDIFLPPSEIKRIARFSGITQNQKELEEWLVNNSPIPCLLVHYSNIPGNEQSAIAVRILSDSNINRNGFFTRLHPDRIYVSQTLKTEIIKDEADDSFALVPLIGINQNITVSEGRKIEYKTDDLHLSNWELGKFIQISPRCSFIYCSLDQPNPIEYSTDGDKVYYQNKTLKLGGESWFRRYSIYEIIEGKKYDWISKGTGDCVGELDHFEANNIGAEVLIPAYFVIKKYSDN
jgi:hypothetical protein